MAFAELGDVLLFYTDDGPRDSAPALLLVHGWGADSHQWVQHIPALSQRHRVIAVDLRGHGYSSAPTSGNIPRRMADDLARLCAHLGVSSVIPVGHSMGGQVAAHLAVEHPHLVHAVINVDPAYGFPEAVTSTFPALTESLREGDTGEAAVRIDSWCYTPASPAWLREWHRRRLLATPPHVLIESFEALWNAESIGPLPNSEEYLSGRTCPVLTFWADPARAAWETGVMRGPRSRAVAWKGSGHRLHEERPAEFLLIVKNWLKEVAR